MKNKKLKKAGLLILVAGVLTGSYIAINKNKLDYVSDFNYVYNYLENSYPNFYRNGTDYWLNYKEEYLKLIKSSKNDEEFIKNMSGILYGLHDMHVSMLDKKSFLNFFNLSKELRDEQEGKDDYIGDETLKKYGVTEEEIKEQKERDIKIGKKILNDSEGKDNLSVGNIVPGKMAYIKLNQMLLLKFATVENRDIKFVENELLKKDKKILLDFLKRIQNYDSLVIDLRENPGGQFFYVSHFFLPTIIGDHQYEEVVYKFAKDKDELKKTRESFISFKEYFDVGELETVSHESLNNIRKEVPALEDEKLFKDIEDNFESYMKVKYKTGESLDNSLAFKGKIYVLINETSASSADKFPRVVKINKIGTIVGRRSAGDGEVTTTYKVLPKTKFVMRIITTLDLVKGLNLKDSIAIGPDIYVPDSTYRIKETENGLDFSKDKVIDKVLKMEGY